MTESRKYFKAVYLKGEIYFLYGSNKHGSATSLDKYSILSNSWQCVSNKIVNQERFTAGCLINKIYICGGVRFDRKKITWLKNTAKVFDTKDLIWTEISGMKYNKEYAASSAYQGQLVVSGGYDIYRRRPINNVEAFDHTLNE